MPFATLAAPNKHLQFAGTAVIKTCKRLWVLLTLILIPVQFSYGAVIEDTSSSATLSGGTSISWNHTTGASADRLLLVSVSTVGAVTSGS